MNVSVTDYLHGPFEIVVTDPSNPLDKTYPMVVAPDGGYPTKEAALEYIEKHFAHRKTPYLDLHFSVAQRSSEQSFIAYCSWED